MKNFCVWLVGFEMVAFAALYTNKIRKREISPALSTWIVFLLGTSLSLTTYAIAERHDFRSGILNMVDVLSVIMVLIAIMKWGKRSLKLELFEQLYLYGVVSVVAYGLASGNAWRSNIFTQVLIGSGYVPTFWKLWKEKRNTESFVAWGLGVITALTALYPAVSGGNFLAVLYAVRTIVLVLILLTIMAYYELRSRRTKP